MMVGHAATGPDDHRKVMGRGPVSRAMPVLITFLVLAAAIFRLTGPALAQVGTPDVETLGLVWENSDGHNATLWNIRWSPDGTLISGAFFDETVTIFDAGTGEIVHKITPYDTDLGRGVEDEGDCGEDGSGSDGTSGRCWGGKDSDIESYWPVRVTAWSPDGDYLAVGGDKANVSIYHTSNWSLYKVLEGYRASIQSLAWSQDGELLATGTGTDKVDMHNMAINEIWLWNTTTWLTEEVLEGHGDAVLDLRWSPNGTRLASASDDKSIRIWVRGTWEVEKVLLGHTLGVLDVAWSPDGETLLSGSRDYKIIKWDYATGERTDRYNEANCVRSVDFHPTGDIYANSGVDEVQLKVRDTDTGSVLKSFTEGASSKSDIMSSRWSPDGERLASAAGKEHALRVYSFGISSGEEDGGGELEAALPGLMVFIMVTVVVVAVVYYPLYRRRKEGGL